MTVGENAVPWDRLDTNTCERLVAVLLSRLHPETQRIDGSGGDGGRDVIFPGPGGVEIYEIKSFTGRLTASRREQIKRSLARASEHDPVRWHLIVPIQPTPGELDWFGEVVEPFSFPCEWKGIDWLDGQMASHRDVAEYFVGGSADRVVELLQQLQREEAALTQGVEDAVERFRRLARQVDDLNPFFRYSFQVDDGTVTVSWLPKYPGALEDSPITISGSFLFDETEEGQAAAAAFQDALDYGTAATIPGRYIQELSISAPGLADPSGEFLEISVGSIAGEDLPELDTTIRALRDGDLVVSVPLQLTGRRSGLRGGELDFVDHSGAFEVTFRMDPISSRANISYRYTRREGILPASLVPPLRLLNALTEGCSVELVTDGRVTSLGDAPSQPGSNSPTAFLAFVEALSLFQERTGLFFPLTEGWEDGELETLQYAVSLMRGETVESRPDGLTFTAFTDGLDEVRAMLTSADEPSPLVVEADLSVDLRGHRARVGRVRRTALVLVDSWPHLPDDEVPETVEIPLKIAGDGIMREVLLRETGDPLRADQLPT